MGVLAAVASSIAGTQTNIDHVSLLERDGDSSSLKFELQVRDRKHLARILRTGARLLLLDEISEGLAPVIVQKLGEVIRKLKEREYTIVLVEQNFRFAAPLADRMYIVEHGQIAAYQPQQNQGYRRGFLFQRDYFLLRIPQYCPNFHPHVQ
jgi:ABC-type branched-subunit amino acid transport system ATPase component